MTDPKEAAKSIVAKLSMGKKGPEEDVTDEDKASMRDESASYEAQSIIDAISAGDASALSSALKNFVGLCKDDDSDYEG